MKNLLLILLLAFLFQHSNAQTPTQVVTTPGNTYVYVGSLTLPYNSSGNNQKIIVKILGGSWVGDSNGETTFYISNRDGLAINQTSIGSATGGMLTLRTYQNGGNTDFYIVPLSTWYAGFAVTSYTFGNGAGFVTITTRSTVPPGTDITGSTPIVPVMTTDASGNVGIGTADTKTYKLAVNGGIRSKQIKVETANWPDFVFAQEYQLPSLSDIKRFVEEKHHLPDMPSAEEVHREGLDLGEMNRLLLKKVEELTLYLLDKDTQLSLQRDQLDIQQKAIEDIKYSLGAEMEELKKQVAAISDNRLIK